MLPLDVSSTDEFPAPNWKVAFDALLPLRLAREARHSTLPFDVDARTLPAKAGLTRKVISPFDVEALTGPAALDARETVMSPLDDAAVTRPLTSRSVTSELLVVASALPEMRLATISPLLVLAMRSPA